VLSARSLAASAVIVLAASTTASAASPAVALAASLKRSMQASYTEHKTGFVFTAVVCKLAATGTTATCQAHFTATSIRAIGVIQVNAKIDRSTGGVSYQPVSIKCTDSKTHKPLASC
jgi:hypothetical protein